MYTEDEFLQMAGLQHYCFCPRQWALIHVENQWDDNSRTTRGEIMHKRVDDPMSFEKRKNIVISRSIPVRSTTLGLSGICDVVEFTLSENGVKIPGRKGAYIVCPIEYKVGSPKTGDEDEVQLCAQVMALEEMFSTEINTAQLYYGSTKRRVNIPMDDVIREKTLSLARQMHELYDCGKTPHAIYNKSCKACSLIDICMPSLSDRKSVNEYLIDMEAED